MVKFLRTAVIGYSYSLTSEAVAACDFGWYAYFGANAYVYPSSPWTNAKWSAQAINLNLTYSSRYLNQISSRSQQSKNDGMGAIMTYDLRVHTDRDPLAALQKIGEGAFSGTVTRASTPANGYAKDWTATVGTEITYADIQ